MWYMLIGAPFLLIGALIFGFSLFNGLRHLSDSLTQIVVPGQADLALNPGETYTVYAESNAVVNGRSYPGGNSLKGLHCEVHQLPGGEAVSLRRPGMTTTYNLGARTGRSILEFTVPAPGDYLFACASRESGSPPEEVIAVGPGISTKIAAMVTRSLLAVFGGGGIALIVFLTVIAKRDRSKRRIREMGLRPV